jgi:hypothetical protein
MSEDRFPALVGWMVPLLSHDDRENVTHLADGDVGPGA